jgi:hypothetical protein
MDHWRRRKENAYQEEKIQTGHYAKEHLTEVDPSQRERWEVDAKQEQCNESIEKEE